MISSSFCNKEMSEKLFALGYNNQCEYVWCKEHYARREATRAFGRLTGPEYCKLTKEYGGTLDFDEVFREEWNLRPYDKRTDDYSFAVSVTDAINWLHINGMRFTVDIRDGKWSSSYVSNIKFDDYDVDTHAYGNTPNGLFNDIVFRGIELFEERKSKLCQ